MTRRIRSLTRAVEHPGRDYSAGGTAGRDEISRLGGAFNDMAERLERSAREILAKEYTDSILANAGEGICGVDAQDRITFANEAAGRITGLGIEGLLERDAGGLLPDADLPSATRPSARARCNGPTVRPCRSRTRSRDRQGRPADRRGHRDARRHPAAGTRTRPSAPGAARRADRPAEPSCSCDRIEHAIARARATGDAGVLYLDLDGFKTVNDSSATTPGDLLLSEEAERLPGRSARRTRWRGWAATSSWCCSRALPDGGGPQRRGAGAGLPDAQAGRSEHGREA